MARASDNARWLGVVLAPNRTASELSLQLGASSRVMTRRASLAVSSTSNAGQARPCCSAKCSQETHVERCVVGDQDASLRELEELGEDLLDRWRTGHHRVGDPGEHRNERRDRLVGVDQRLELAQHLATADLDRANLRDHRAVLGGPSGGLEVDDAERDVLQSPTELVEAALRLPPSLTGKASRRARGGGAAHGPDARSGHRLNRDTTRHTGSLETELA